jgi:hypothetical protein
VNREQALESLKRIIASHNFPGGSGQQVEYVQSVIDACGHIDAYRFEQTVKRLVENWTTNYLPKPGHYLQTYKVLAQENGWDKQDKEKWKCDPCSSTGFVRVRVMKDMGGTPVHYDALSNCPRCRPNWIRDDDLVFDETPTESFYLKCARLSKADGSLFIFDKIMNRGLEIPQLDQVLNVLTERMKEFPPVGKGSGFADAVNKVAPPAVPVAKDQDIPF